MSDAAFFTLFGFFLASAAGLVMTTTTEQARENLRAWWIALMTRGN